MIKAFIKATDQIFDPQTRRIVWIAFATTVGLFCLLWLAVGIILLNTTFFAVEWLEIIKCNFFVVFEVLPPVYS